MADETTTDAWSTQKTKIAAVNAVLKHLAAHRTEQQVLDCVGNDANAHQLFKTVSGMDVPAGQRVIIFASGERYRDDVGASVILEIPPPPDPGKPPLSDIRLKDYVLGYPYWPPAAQTPPAPPGP